MCASLNNVTWHGTPLNLMLYLCMDLYVEFMLFCRFDCFELGFFAGHYVVRLLSVLACSSPPPPCGVALHHVTGPLLCGLSLVLLAIPLQLDAWLLSGPLLQALLLCAVCACAPVSLSSTLSSVTMPGEDSRSRGAFRYQAMSRCFPERLHPAAPAAGVHTSCANTQNHQPCGHTLPPACGFNSFA